MPLRTFDDFTVGESFDFGPKHLTRGEIIAFAAEFDPQPFHLDEQSPATELVGGLIASGWHACAIYMRMMCDGLLLQSTCLGSPGIDTLKWQRPLRPGDRLRGRATVLETRASKSRPDMGIVRFRHELTNQTGEVAMRMENPILFGRRTP